MFGVRGAKVGGRGLAIARRQRRAVSYLACDTFRTPDAAPLTSPRTCEPGPGQLVATQADGALAVNDEGLALSAQSSPTTGDLAARIVDAVARTAQRPLVADVRMDDGLAWIGFWPSTALNASSAHAVRYFFEGGATSIGHGPAPHGGLAGIGEGMRTRVMVQPRAAGGAYYYLHYPGFMSRWTLFGFDRHGTATSLYGGLANDSGVGVCRKLAVVDESFVPTAAVDQATPALNTNIAAPAEAVVDVKFTLGASLVNGHQAEIRLRHQDADNYWSLQLAVTNGVAVLGLEEVTGGEATLRSAETLPLGPGESAYVQASLGPGLYFCRWRATDAAAQINSSLLYIDMESRGNDRVAALQLSVTGTPTISDLTVYPMASKEIPRAI